jgi:hypothetical protein
VGGTLVCGWQMHTQGTLRGVSAVVTLTCLNSRMVPLISGELTMSDASSCISRFRLMKKVGGCSTTHGESDEYIESCHGLWVRAGTHVEGMRHTLASSGMLCLANSLAMSLAGAPSASALGLLEAPCVDMAISALAKSRRSSSEMDGWRRRS